MQLDLSEYSDNFLLQLLANDLIKREKEVRYNLVLHNITEKILMKWIDYVHANHLFKKPIKCAVRFVERDISAINSYRSVETLQPFTLIATLNNSFAETVDEYCNSVRDALSSMKRELRDKYDLDKIEFYGEDAIQIYEYHDLTQGL